MLLKLGENAGFRRVPRGPSKMARQPETEHS